MAYSEIPDVTRESILKMAEKAVTGQRATDYGRPEDNFRQIARMWGAYLGVTLTPIDVAMMMVLLKTARVCHGSGNLDNYVDIAGYAACAGAIAAAESEFYDNEVGT